MAKRLDWQNVYEMLDNMLTGVAVFGLHEERIELLYLNRGGFRMLGYSEELGYKYLNNLVSVIVEEDKPKFWQAIGDILKDNGAVDLEIRTVTATGNLRWLQIRGNLYMNTDDGGAVILCVFMDATDRKFVEDEMRLQSEWYQMLLETEGEILVDYNTTSDVLSVKQASRHGMENNRMLDRYLMKMRRNAQQYEGSAKIVELVESVMRYPGTEIIEAKTRLYLIDEAMEERWYCFHITGIAGVDGYVTHVVGKITDISKQKQMEEELRERDTRDLLTGWFNLEESKRQIQDILEKSDAESTLHAFILVDLSSFRFVAESLGNDIGERLLRDVTSKVGKSVKRTDVLGRLNQDEFILFVQNVGNVTNLDTIAARVQKNTEVALEAGNDSMTLSGRIGVSVYPYHGTTMEALQRRAEMAVDTLRTSGKDGYHIHDLSGLYQKEHEKNDRQYRFLEDEEEFTSETFEDVLYAILSENKWNENLVRAFLKMIVRHYGLQRAFLLFPEEGNEKFQHYHYCEKGYLLKDNQTAEEVLHACIRFLEQTNRVDGYQIVNSYDPIPEEISLYMIRNSIRTSIMKPLYLCGKIGGIFVLSECEGKEFKLERESEKEFKRVLQIVQTCVLRYRHNQTGHSVLQEVKMAEDFDSYAFAADYDTYELCFANRKLLEALPDLQIGDYCYRTFAGLDAPCEDCIMKKLDRKELHARRSEERFNNALRSWLKVHASWIHNEEGSAACLMNCIDISEYFMGMSGQF